jgi:hypothetical protein
LTGGASPHIVSPWVENEHDAFFDFSSRNVNQRKLKKKGSFPLTEAVL